MARPLLVTDCDEVLLHMVVPFREWVARAHDVHFDFASQDFARALRHKLTGDPIDNERIWPLLAEFFQTQMHMQAPIEDAAEALGRLSRTADIVILTNIGEDMQEARAAQLRAVGIDYPVIGNVGGKGRPLALLIEEYGPSVTVFVDDLSHNHESGAKHAPSAWRLQMVGEPEMARHVVSTPFAHARIDRWNEALAWIEDRFEKGVGAGM